MGDVKKVKIPVKVKREIERAMKWKAKAKALEVEAKALNQQSKDILLPLMMSYEIKDYTVNGLGKAYIRTSKGSSINAKALRENLILEGLPLDRIEAVMESSTKTWSTDYVGFKGE